MKRSTSSTSRHDRRHETGLSLDSVMGGAPSPNLAAIIAGELAALAADAQVLGARLSPGDIVAAVVLPSNGLTDLLEVGGLRVAAELPPTLVPGEAITVMVTGVGDGRINLRILTGPEAVASDPAVRGPSVPAVQRGVPMPVTGEGVRANGGRATLAAVAGSDTRSQTARLQAPAAPIMPSLRAALPGASQPVSSAQPALENIEARLAAAHAMTAPTSRPAATPARKAGDAAPAATAGRLLGRPALATARPPISVRPPMRPSHPASNDRASGEPVARGAAAYAEPTLLLRALRLAVTPTNVAAARMALQLPQTLPTALATLERGLADRSDPRSATLRALATFVGRLDPRSPVLGAQIAAFVDHVAIGGEAKLAQLARAVDEAGPAAGNAASAAAPTAPPRALERLVVARAALDYDLKTQLLAVAADAASNADGAAPKIAALDAAVAGALTAITALQLNAANALSANPDGLAFIVPVTLPDGVAAARVRIDRDAADGRKTALDGDNFHISFVLETRHLGTVGIDLMTVGRTVTVSVKTETAPAQRVFGTALTGLTARLEKLRYRVAKADAAVATLADQGREPSVARPVSDPNRLVDTDA